MKTFIKFFIFLQAYNHIRICSPGINTSDLFIIATIFNVFCALCTIDSLWSTDYNNAKELCKRSHENVVTDGNNIMLQ